MQPEMNRLFDNVPLPRLVFSQPHPVQLLLNSRGDILKIGDKWAPRYSSMAEELSSAGNVRSFFNLSPYATLDKVPGVQDLRHPPGPLPDDSALVRFRNCRPFARDEDPEGFYTTLPTAMLFIVYKAGPDHFIAFVRAMDTPPSLFPSRPNGIIYIDNSDRLVGFNHTFYSFFSSKFKEPFLLLDKPASLVLHPSPLRLQRTQLANLSLPEPAELETTFRYSAEESIDSKELSISHPENLSFTEKGLLCKESEDALFLTLPGHVDTRKDFKLTVEASSLSGTLPVLVIGEEYRAKRYPDSPGYLIGPDPHEPVFFLKRRGIVHFTGDAVTREKRSTFTLHKLGNGIFFFQGRQKKLAFYDFEFLHQAEARLTIGIRQHSSSLIHSIILGVRGTEESAPRTSLPVIRLKTVEQNYFMLNRFNMNTLSTSFPHVSAYILENITEIQKQVNALRTERKLLLADSGISGDAFICRNPIMVSLKKKAAVLALTESGVLVQGETGTGKEVLAKFIHEQSRCKEGPFIKVDCATIPQELVESELFGHEKGAFTGAVERRIGLFEQAEGGTLFLDEVGNLTLSIQAKLLHFLQDHTVTRLGGAKPVIVRVRIIVASNSPLSDLVKKGLFRSDLFYRMDVVSITLPPLRERREDIPELCDHFIRILNATHHKNIRGLSQAAVKKIMDHSWPGNVRELKNTLDRAVIFCGDRLISPLLISFTDTIPAREEKGKRKYRFIQTPIPEIRALFRKHGFVAKAVARALEVSPRSLYYHLKRNGYNIDKIRSALDQE